MVTPRNSAPHQNNRVILVVTLEEAKAKTNGTTLLGSYSFFLEGNISDLPNNVASIGSTIWIQSPVKKAGTPRRIWNSWPSLLRSVSGGRLSLRCLTEQEQKTWSRTDLSPYAGNTLLKQGLTILTLLHWNPCSNLKWGTRSYWMNFLISKIKPANWMNLFSINKVLP